MSVLTKILGDPNAREVKRHGDRVAEINELEPVVQKLSDVQLIGGIVLHQGKIAEMKTGEGKTLVAVLPLYLNALEGKGVHLVTVNDYLARRDAGWNRPVYERLGMKVAVIGHEMSLLYDPGYVDETHVDPRLQHLRPI